MQCPFCQNEMGNVQNACPRCQRPHSPYVAYQVAKGWNDMQRGAQKDAQAAFTEALRVTPSNDKPQLQSYIAYLVQQAATPGSAAARAVAAQQPARPAAQPSAATVSAPTPSRGMGSPPSPTVKRALFLHFNEKPVNIIRVMDDARAKQMEYAKARTRRTWLVALLIPAGLPFIFADLALGYNVCTFSLIALVLWGAAVVGFILLMRNRPTGKEFGPRFDSARTVFETIQDDLSPKRTLIGWLDLTGPQQPSKVVRQNTSSSGMPINYYRDEWLKMKMMLYDGNVMRVSALERVKARMGRWKRNRRGKSKWKAGGNISRNELRVAITVNREAYDVLPLQTNQSGKFLIEARESGDGRIVLDALTDAAIGAQDILQLLRFAYDHLKPRGASASIGG